MLGRELTGRFSEIVCYGCALLLGTVITHSSTRLMFCVVYMAYTYQRNILQKLLVLLLFHCVYFVNVMKNANSGMVDLCHNDGVCKQL